VDAVARVGARCAGTRGPTEPRLGSRCSLPAGWFVTPPCSRFWPRVVDLLCAVQPRATQCGRQVWRLLKAFRSDGIAGLISKKRGRPSNHRTTASVRTAAPWIVRHNYADFGPTLAAEKLAAEHGFGFSGETLRKWMIADGLWLDRKQRQGRIHQPRPRRECVGELVQVDGSEHWWFEDRGPQCTLLVLIDDATSRLMHLQFVESESTFAYFHAARAYLQAWGKPIAFYSDKHGVFRVNHPGALGGDGMTQFGRALHALNIDIICANSSPAKGRVERANRTLQDRLVKELRLAGAATLAEGNALLPAFICISSNLS
jgi:hypothetical protein